MTLTFRPYQHEDDYWRMRAFLREVFLLNDRHEYSWPVARLDYSRWHVCLNCANVRLEDVAFLWEDGGRLAAMMMPDGGPGEAHLCVDPRCKTAQLEEEMLDVAEERLSARGADGSRSLVVWVHDNDSLRQEILLRRGYRKGQDVESQWRRVLDGRPIEDAPLAAGYTIRPMGDGLELVERCWASGLGFHEDEIRYAIENRADVTWYRNIQNAPLYRRDLDLVAVAPDGSTAAFATMWFDDVTRSAIFEPVATVPAHRRKGLGKALLTEGLRRLQRMGATLAMVGGYSPRANALYRSVMGDDHDRCESWEKTWFN